MVSLLSPTVPVLCDMLCWEDIFLLLSHACEMIQGDCNKLACSLRSVEGINHVYTSL